VGYVGYLYPFHGWSAGRGLSLFPLDMLTREGPYRARALNKNKDLRLENVGGNFKVSESQGLKARVWGWSDGTEKTASI